jgi:ubiquinone/menaquinone biosynthesis C-methylase UbiE
MTDDTRETPTHKTTLQSDQKQSHVSPTGGDTERLPDVFRGRIARSYDAWYEQPDNRPLVELEKKALLEMMMPRKGETLLDVGCGTGYFSLYFSQNDLQVVGLDCSEDMLNIARQKGNRLPLVMGDAHRLPFPDETFDISTAMTTLEFTKHPGVVLQELYRVCKRVVVLGVLERLSWLALKRKLRKEGPFPQATFYSIRELKKLIRRHLRDVEITTKRPFRAFIVATITKS